MEQQTLLGLFEKQEHDFYSELSTMILPRDKEKLQTFMRNFFVNKVSVEEYKKELTMGEVAMLNSVLKMIPFQMPMFKSCTLALGDDVKEVNHKSGDSILKDKETISTIGFTAVGGAIGSLLFKETWGGVLLTIAACALGLYMNKGQRSNRKKQSQVRIDATKYIATLKNICATIDEIIGNYRASLNQVKQSYEGLPKVTLATEYRPLLDRFASMFVALKGLSVPTDVQLEIDKLYRTLKNHHYEIVDYTEATADYYVETESEHVSECTLVKAAILENGNLLIKGECLIPINK